MRFKKNKQRRNAETWQKNTIQNNIEDLRAIYKDYMYAVRQYEDLFKSSSVVDLAWAKTQDFVATYDTFDARQMIKTQKER